MSAEIKCDDCGAEIKPQSDRQMAEMIAKFRTPPGFSWQDLANDIETALAARREWGWPR